MKLEKISLGETGNFSPIFLDYIAGKPSLQPFYDSPPTPDSFEKKIQGKAFSQANREILHQVLKQQYLSLTVHTAVEQNIDALLQSQTFTVTTGHQLNIFSGPLYFVYKIVTTINACKVLQEKYPHHRFVPVYWMATEDHDFEEINHFSLFGNTYVWQTAQTGAVGRFKPDMEQLFKTIPEKLPLFEKAYQQATLADATRYFVNALFGESGLVVLNADHADLKALLKPVIKDDLLNHHAVSLAGKASEELEELGYKAQVHPREINFFYLDEGIRERLVKEAGSYFVLNTDLQFSEEELLDVLDKHPEKFSPNVVMRPLYQEVILPNLAYIGGPGELAYWLQLKGVFEKYETPFPLLMPRNFALIINRVCAKRLYKLGIHLPDLFLPKQALRAQYVEANSHGSYNIERENQVVQQVFNALQVKATSIDPSLKGYVGAAGASAIKLLERMENKMRKAEEKHHEISLGQLDALKAALFPGNGLQERVENFLSFQINTPDFIGAIQAVLDPFDYRFNILIEDEQA